MKWNARLKLLDVERFNKVDNFRAIGYIYDDERGKFKNGEEIVTSRIEQLDFISGYLMTKNSTYKLILEEQND